MKKFGSIPTKVRVTTLLKIDCNSVSVPSQIGQKLIQIKIIGKGKNHLGFDFEDKVYTSVIKKLN